ncbi:hypothetical protein TSTA_117220 [Talaromyces stipitatus ATCC 10500]|uniref:Hydrophobin n=1 Tax=Talaromyces stipitatus (strain ATCC 10500 / CBS 375.48 / QM 6759 / NRRL 1006) TaxID=441959 RepID=B8MDH3_TALSN|nr:uncharacterized protein TSTA_117220 [Talaromyces stipitatus ATCC 10500]EED17936.1 hypothetical protein TSTA_117220 [Talaromyces stipitatus ATCC 10500]
MFLDPTPLAIALAIILSTSPHVLAAPHRKHHNIVLGRSNDQIQNYDQRYAHGPLQIATPSFQTPSVTVQSVRTITVFPTPVRTLMPSNMQFLPPPGMPMPNGTRKPVEKSSSTSSSSSSTAPTTTSKTTVSSTSQATKAAAASSSSASIIVVALPSSSFTITVPGATSVTIPSIATPTTTLPSIIAIEDNAASEILSVLATDLAQTTNTDSNSDSGDTNSMQSDAGTETNSSQQSAITAATSTCSRGTTRKCCSAAHNDLKKVVNALDGITGFDLSFLRPDTSVGLDCADINDNDSTEDGAVCWDVTTLSSIYVGCVPVV